MEGCVKNFYDLNAWKNSHLLVLEVYRVTASFPQSELFGLTSQLRRAASSISANIAEGFERYHYKDKIKFYYQARGSAAEVQNFIILSRDLKLVSNNDCALIGQKAKDSMQLINGLIRVTGKKIS